MVLSVRYREALIMKIYVLTSQTRGLSIAAQPCKE
jgi:hypothetical protein